MNYDNLPLFVVLGATCTGKSSAMEILRKRGSDRYVVMNGELCNVPAFPEVISECRQSWIEVCFDVMHQTGRSVVFYTDLYPDCFDEIEKDKHDRMRFAAFVCKEDVLRKRLESKFGDQANELIGADGTQTYMDLALTRNRIYEGNTSYSLPDIKRFDTTSFSPEQTADYIEQWIISERKLDDDE